MLYFMIGLARSGKSTAAYALSKQVEKSIVLSLDDFRKALGHRYNYHCEGSVFLSSTIAAKALIIGGYTVILDDTHTTEESVRNAFRICPGAKYIRMDTSVEVCKKRAIDSQRQDLLAVIDRQAENLNKLTNERIEEIRREVINHSSRGYITND